MSFREPKTRRWLFRTGMSIGVFVPFWPDVARSWLAQGSAAASSSVATVWTDGGSFQRTTARLVWTDQGALTLP